MRVSEIYASSQGEGPNVGKTTIFLRFGGCNLSCAGWPCDTQHAIDPAYRKEWLNQTPQTVFNRVLEAADLVGANLVTLTGGEPFLQPNSELYTLTELLHRSDFQVDCFSNGTLEYPLWAPSRISFIMDWKLSGSGEDPDNKIRLENLERLAQSELPQAVKFVIKDEQDLHQAHALWSVFMSGGAASFLEVFYGRVWGADIRDKDLVAYVMQNKLPWRLNMQTHNLIWPANERGR